MKLGVHIERWPAIRPFRITDTTWTSFDSVVVELFTDGCLGRGEALGVYYLRETADTLASQVEAVADAVKAGIDRIRLQELMPPGGAAAAIGHQLLKIKLNNDRPLERLQAVRAARPDVRIVVDANQAWTFATLRALAPEFAALGVQLIEQPLARGEDAELEGYQSPVPLCADESCLHLGELTQAAERYQWINVKLDKTGGLTAALQLAYAARARGLGLMVGCMGGSSLAMAPAFVVGCLCDVVDIDGPLLQRSDRLPGLDYDGGRVSVFGPSLWG